MAFFQSSIRWTSRLIFPSRAAFCGLFSKAFRVPERTEPGKFSCFQSVLSIFRAFVEPTKQLGLTLFSPRLCFVSFLFFPSVFVPLFFCVRRIVFRASVEPHHIDMALVFLSSRLGLNVHTAERQCLRLKELQVNRESTQAELMEASRGVGVQARSTRDWRWLGGGWAVDGRRGGGVGGGGGGVGEWLGVGLEESALSRGFPCLNVFFFLPGAEKAGRNEGEGVVSWGDFAR